MDAIWIATLKLAAAKYLDGFKKMVAILSNNLEPDHFIKIVEASFKDRNPKSFYSPELEVYLSLARREDLSSQLIPILFVKDRFPETCFPSLVTKFVTTLLSE